LKHENALKKCARVAFTTALATTLIGASGCSVLEPPVARRVDGVTTEGRFIDPDAYAMYAVAALREARGQWAEALKLYQRALDIDGRGPELKTRVGAVACKLRQNTLSDRAFAAAARAANDYGPLWFELALCRKSRGDTSAAESAALEAVRLDPERAEASLLAADLAELRGHQALAWQLRDGLATHAPDSPAAQRGILAAAKRNHELARAARAQAALARLDARGGAARQSVGIARALDALGQGDVSTAKREAAQLLGADPTNGDALVIALAVADLEQDHTAFNALLEASSDSGTPASPEVLSTLGALLNRRVSAKAAQLVQPQP
jgi:tetratricopeptide (TPR) repeat protein